MRINVSLFAAFSFPIVAPSKDQSPSFGPKRSESSSKKGCCHLSGRHRMISIDPTPLEPIVFRDRVIYIKRDDVLAFQGVLGSKLRKFYTLLQTDALQHVDEVVSYGGAQSNAMLAIASLCSFHGKRFIYVTRTISRRLHSAPGNYNEAVQAGMIHVQLRNDDFRNTFTDKNLEETETAAIALLRRRGLGSSSNRHLFIPQGGAWQGAEEGIRILAIELEAQITHLRKKGRLSSKKPILFLPAGTGTTAYYLQKHLYGVARVVAIPVSGDERYLMKQMRWLNKYCDAEQNTLQAPCMPDIIRPRCHSTFADVTSRKLSLWKELTRATNGKVTFDLVYAPKTWEEAMLALAEGRLGKDGEDILYYHSGGVEGNQSMLGKFLGPPITVLLISHPSRPLQIHSSHGLARIRHTTFANRLPLLVP